MSLTSLAAVMLAAAVALTGCGHGADPASGPPNARPATPRHASEDPATPSSSGSAGQPPWAAPTDVPRRVAAAGLDLGPMGMAAHYHSELRVFVNGSEMPVAPSIGVDPSTGAMSAVHTHEGDGTIHVEAVTQGEVFTLGQLFTQWGVRLTSTQVGGVHAKPGRKVIVTSNGTPVAGDPNQLRLRPEQQISVSVG